MYYRRKEKPVQAIQWTCDNYDEVADFTAGNVAISADQTVLIVGGNRVVAGDWIIKLVGQENSVSPLVTRYRVLRDELFVAQFEPTDYVEPPPPLVEEPIKDKDKDKP